MTDPSAEFVWLQPPAGGLQRLLNKREQRQQAWLDWKAGRWPRAAALACLLLVVVSWTAWRSQPDASGISAERLAALAAPSDRPIQVEGGQLARIDGTPEDVELFVVMRVKHVEGG
jgi:hypothetical protein